MLAVTEMPAHNHGGATGNDAPDHSHSGSTAGANARHTHNAGRQTPLSLAAGTNSYTVVTAVYSDWGTGVDSPDHAHAFGTGGASTRHTHTISSQGGGATHNNMPPFAVCSYFIKT